MENILLQLKVDTGVVEETVEDPLCYSIFEVPKKPSDHRVVLNFNEINCCMEMQPYSDLKRGFVLALV